MEGVASPERVRPVTSITADNFASNAHNVPLSMLPACAYLSGGVVLVDMMSVAAVRGHGVLRAADAIFQQGCDTAGARSDVVLIALSLFAFGAKAFN